MLTFFTDAVMTDADKGLEESMALAQQLDAEQNEANAQVQMLENQIENEGIQAQGGSISSYVNQSYVNQLLELGFTKDVAEKALFLNLSTPGEPIANALDWISAHSDDSDFHEALQVVGQSEATSGPKSTLTKEEKLKKAKELQESIRKKRAEEEKRLNEEREKQRVHGAKAMSEVKRKMEEEQKKIALDVQKREKQEFLAAKQRMLEQLERDKQERFGKKAGDSSSGTTSQQQPQKQVLEGIELVKHGIKLVKTLYTEDRQPGVAKTCFKTLTVYLNNAINNPTEDKFKRINQANEAFQKRVGKINGGMSILKGVGFIEQDDGSLFLEKYDVEIMREAVRCLENNL
ncbi:pub domain-containing protein [Stylonychia lemnae]|uniref:Pub domain-containing protein n=1 Tax=Stylonychia lemnae TaxID=5949 RepID=A0A078A7V2_STYLE|nr:pub domain-containing protein [Stylonychia lemnae]|eukprot:CDW78340.1 pub domain-containing protein [Stylonychia lemnae]